MFNSNVAKDFKFKRTNMLTNFVHCHNSVYLTIVYNLIILHALNIE